MYVLCVFVLAIIEESMVYFIGGGLGGKATSWWHTIALAVPVFTMIGVSILILQSFYTISTGEAFLIGFGVGLAVEIFVSGHSPLFIGGGAGIYGMMMAAMYSKTVDELSGSSLKRVLMIFVGIIMAFAFGGIIGGIIGDNIYKK